MRPAGRSDDASARAKLYDIAVIGGGSAGCALAGRLHGDERRVVPVLRLMRNRGAAAQPTTLFVLALTMASAAGAQPRPYRPYATGDRVRDSLDYVRDSALIDSIAGTVPIDSLRALYRHVARGPDPIRAVHAISCEAYRLWYTYGLAAQLAEQRVRAAEWTPDRDSAVVRALDRASEEARELHYRYLLHGFLLPPTDCREPTGVPLVADARLRHRPPHVPGRPRRSFPRGTNRDSLRTGASYFEATLSARLATVDTTMEFAGSPQLEFTNMGYLELSLYDHLRTDSRFSLSLRRPGRELLRAGSYPIFGRHELNGVPDVVSASVTTWRFIGMNRDKVWGTLVVERADTAEVHGHVDIWIHRNGLHPWRWLLHADSLRDTVRITAQFRAVYHWDRVYLIRGPGSIPDYPHRMANGVAPDARTTAQRLFLDERTPCERLPVYSPESVLSPLPATHPRAMATAVLDIRPDTAGRIGARAGWKDIRVLAIDDTSLVRTFEGQSRLRLRKTAPHQVYARVRCTLTLRREH